MRRLLFLMPILLCAAVSAHAQSLDAFKHLAFFKYSHHGKITVDSTDGLRDDTTALITYQEQFNPPALQCFGRCRA